MDLYPEDNSLLFKLQNSHSHISCNSEKNSKKIKISREESIKIQDNIFKYNNLDEPFLMFYKNQHEPLIFRNSKHKDISEEHEKNFILDPDVCKCIIGLVFTDYNIDYETVKIETVYKILGYLQFYKREKCISKNGFIHHYGILDTNKQEQVIHLYSQDIPEPCFAISKFKPVNTATINYCYTDFEGEQYVCPIVSKKYKTIHITMEYLFDIFDTGILEFLDIFTLSKIISCRIPNP